MNHNDNLEKNQNRYINNFYIYYNILEIIFILKIINFQIILINLIKFHTKFVSDLFIEINITISMNKYFLIN